MALYPTQDHSMWAKVRASTIGKSSKLPSSIFVCYAQLHSFSQPVLISDFEDGKQQRNKRFNVNDEYLCTVRTKSYVEFYIKAQSLIQESPPSESSSTGERCKVSESILLEPGQEAIPSILESPFLAMLPELKGLFVDYFDVSAEASNLCTHLLANVKRARSNSRFIQQSLASIEKCSSPETIETIVSELLALRVPFSDPDKHGFTVIHDDYAAVSRRLNYMTKKVARKIKLIKIIERLSCGLVAITARTLTALVMAASPALFGFQPKALHRKLLSHQMLGNGVLSKAGEELEAAAKGSYILNRELETMSRLVARLDDAIQHSKAMLWLLVERKEDKFAVQVAMEELRKSHLNLRKQVEDVEEHLYVCIVTVNRARASMINQMTSHPS